MKVDQRRMPHVLCPACGGKAFARSIGKVSLVYRELYYHCHDAITCGHQFVVSMEAVRTVRHSICPIPKASLPTTTWRRPANDLGAANDDAPPPTPPAAAAMTN